ncbi:MAG: hypothetical protein WC985_00275 [Thermoplasmata archaeon]
MTILASGSPASAFTVLVRESWLRSLIRNPSFLGTVVKPVYYAGATWFGAKVTDGSKGLSVVVKEFAPEVGKSWYTLGSPSSILLERPMFISIAELPHIAVQEVAMSNSNGSWIEQRPIPHVRLGISFTDANTSGQTVVLNRSWLAGYGFADAQFRYADGTPIPTRSDNSFYYLSPPHFSILYAFTVSDGFVKESDQPYSNVFWDSSNRKVYALSDRRDPAGTNERMSSPAPVTYDQTTSFTIRGTWKTSQQGNWQIAVPLFFMSAANTKVDMANSIYVLYASRDSNLGNQPLYYLRYRDSSGTLRIDFNVAWNANVQVEFMFYYDAPSKYMLLYIYDINGNGLGARGYFLGASETFVLGKIGAAAWGAASTAEPTTIGTADNLFMDANRARNGNFEVDGNSDGVPDYWQNWIWTKGNVYRSSDRAKYGSWSVKIADSSNSLDYGLQTNRLSASAGQTFTGSSWVYAASGTFSICVEAWNSAGARLAVSCRNTATHNLWEYLDVSLGGPSGTATVDLLLYSGGGNTGTGYFDGSELRLRRAFWSVTVHNGEPAVPSGLAGWQVAIDRAADLGVSYIRTDFPWSAFQQAGNGIWTQSTIDYWQSVRNMAKTRGIDLIAILNGPAPSGVDSNNVYQSFQDFCRGIGGYFGGGSIYYFQLLNEVNWVPSQNLPGDITTLISNCYAGLVVGTGTIDFTHRSQFKTVMNVYVTVAWDISLVYALANTGNSIDVAAIDYYPGSINNPNNQCSDWSPLDTLFNIMKASGREGAIMETGYPTVPDFNGYVNYQAQSDYIDCAFPVILSKVSADNANAPPTPFVLANWYELYDHNTGSHNPLDNYGMIKSGGQGDKPSYANFRSRVPGFGF